VLAVGDSTELEIIFSTKSYHSRTSKRPRISTNEKGKESTHYVRINAHVVERPDSTYPVIIDPYKFDLSQFNDNVVDEKKFEIVNVSDQDLKVTLIDWPRDFCEIDLPESIGRGKTGVGEVRLKEAGLADAFEKSMTIELSDENKTRFTIPIKRSVRVSASTGDASTSRNEAGVRKAGH
jgi:hypothetical protein